MCAAPAKKTAAKTPDTRQRLLEAAREEFGARGIEAATTRGIAQRAGCNEVTLFRHFESKQGLLAAVVQGTSEEFCAMCGCEGECSGELRADLGEFARVYNDALEHFEGIARALIGECRRQPVLSKELIGDGLEPLHRNIAAYLEQRKADGVVRVDLDAMVFAEVFTSSLMGGLLRRTSGFSDMDRDSWLQETVEIFVRGIEHIE
jgi:AcrR family transcriptional regulator